MSVKVMRNEENFSSIDETSAIGRFRVADFWILERNFTGQYLSETQTCTFVHWTTGRGLGLRPPGGHGGVLVFFCRNPGHFLGSRPGPYPR